MFCSSVDLPEMMASDVAAWKIESPLRLSCFHAVMREARRSWKVSLSITTSSAMI